MTKTEMDIRLTKIFSTAAIALAAAEKRAVCKQLKQFIREARAQELFALAGEASQNGGVGGQSWPCLTGNDCWPT